MWRSRGNTAKCFPSLAKAARPVNNKRRQGRRPAKSTPAEGKRSPQQSETQRKFWRKSAGVNCSKKLKFSSGNLSFYIYHEKGPLCNPPPLYFFVSHIVSTVRWHLLETVHKVFIKSNCKLQMCNYKRHPF